MKDYTLGAVGSAASWICTIAQTNEIFTIAFTIYKWYNKAKEDGKITKEEIEDLADDISEALGKTEDKK